MVSRNRRGHVVPAIGESIIPVDFGSNRYTPLIRGIPVIAVPLAPGGSRRASPAQDWRISKKTMAPSTLRWLRRELSARTVYHSSDVNDRVDVAQRSGDLA